ncbi:MAG TPA: hypothetical protein VLI69_00240 [Gammaproteobacteria bacterium]|nr:hypothetical protein [Gammaproteobacteria bacterium]
MQDRLVEPNGQSKGGCTDRILKKLLRSKKDKLLHYQSIKNTCLEFFGSCYGLSNLLTSGINIAYALGAPKVPYAVFNSVGGTSWGAAVISFPFAVVFALADAESHTASSKQIDRAAETPPLQIQIPENKNREYPKPDAKILFISGDSDEDAVKTIELTERQWRISIYHFLNDILKTASDCMLIVNILEAVLDSCNIIPPASEKDWIRPAVKFTLNCGFFALGYFANAQELRNTVISYDGENQEKRAAPRQ